MCGFAGISGRWQPGELERMATAVAQRGPDDHGLFEEGGFGAIHHRLSIIGPDVRGRQPMTVDGVTVLFNGCIYNYPQLRRQLEEDGIRFRSDSDTEVLPHLYRRHGDAMFERLNGMFAIVLWDAAARRLVMARDPFGEKPLFVCEQGGRIGFASTLSAFERGDWQLTPNLPAVRDLLVDMRVTAPQSLYREVRQLPPGFMATAAAGETLALQRYFMLPRRDLTAGMGAAERQAAVVATLDRAFAARLLADRPLGIFLSGGVDSSLIAASLAAQAAVPPHTYSVRFSDGSADYDESAYAAKVAAHIGSEHRVLEVRADAQLVLDDLAAAFDQPVTNVAALPTFLISREAKRHVDVALSGVGGDELFGGYPRYLGMAWHGRLAGMPGHRLLHRLVANTGDSGSSRNLRGRLRRFLAGLDCADAEAYRRWTATTDADWRAMFGVEPQPADGRESAAMAEGGLEGLIGHFGPVNGAMAFDILSYLPDDLLAMGDRMSMAHALELRAPFLDVELLALVLPMAAAEKVAGYPWQERLKVMLRRIAAERLPHDVVYRPKQGFMAPVKHWLRGELAADVERLIAGRPLAGLLRPAYLQQEWQRHRQGEDRSDILWGVLLLDRWMRQRGWDFA